MQDGLAMLHHVRDERPVVSRLNCRSCLHDGTGMWHVSRSVASFWNPSSKIYPLHDVAMAVRVGRVGFRFAMRCVYVVSFTLNMDIPAQPAMSMRFLSIFPNRKRHQFFIRKHIRIYVLRYSFVP